MPKKKTHDEFLKEFNKKSNGEYFLIGEYINSKFPINVYHSGCQQTYKVMPTEFIRGKRCMCVSKTKKPTSSDFIEKVNKIGNGEYTIIDTYKNSHEKIKIRHNCGYEYMIYPYHFIQGSKCVKCSGYKKRDTTELILDMEKIYNKEYVVVGEYVNTNTKIKIEHSTCSNIFEVLPKKILKGKCFCPFCYGNSFQEKIILDFLVQNKINFKTQYKFDDLKHKKYLFFDFAIFKDNKLFCLIEYDGEFHYKKTNLKNDLESQKIRDELKNRYCLDHNIKLIRIPYTEKKNIKSILTKELLHFF